MKKALISLLLCVTGLSASAQTNFRHIAFDKVVAAAKNEGKMIFIDFFTDWCGPCKKMATEVFPQKEVGDFMNNKFVCVKYNAEKEGKELAARFEVKAYPTFIILNDKEEVQAEIKGAMDGTDFIAKISANLNPDMSPARMEERYKAGDRTPELVNNYAFYHMEQGKEKEGFKIVDDYFASLTDAQRLSAPNAFIFTRYTMNTDDAKGKFMVAHRSEFDPAVRDAINDRIDKLYNSALFGYFSGYILSSNKYKEDEYQALKKKIQSLGLNTKKYAPMFRFIECRVKNDDAAFMTMCENEFNTLDSSTQGILIMNMSRLINTDDKEILGRMSRFIRSHLSTLDGTTISLAGRLLYDIESKMEKK